MKLLARTLLLIVISFEILDAAKIKPDIIHGSIAEKGKVSYLVSYQQGTFGRYRHFCGGSIIARRYILTAAHCVLSVRWPSITRTKIVAGTPDLRQHPPSRQDIFVKKALIHSGYDTKKKVGPNDIALLYLEKELKFGPNVQPIALRDSTKVSGNGLIVGWGYTEPNDKTPPNVCQTVTVPIISTEDCKQKLAQYIKDGASKVDPTANICTGSKGTGAGSCSGDSGGPLVHAGECVGVVSWGLSPCGEQNAPSVFTRVGSYAAMIKAEIEKNE